MAATVSGVARILDRSNRISGCEKQTLRRPTRCTGPARQCKCATDTSDMDRWLPAVDRTTTLTFVSVLHSSEAKPSSEE